MPARNSIYSEITSIQSGAPDNVRHRFLKQLHNYTKNDVILYSSGFTSFKSGPPNLLSITQHDVQGFMGTLHGLKGENLDIIIHSPGGSLEATEQIVNYLRNKYNKIRAIIPQNAMSAATMLACACDEIIMGKHSALGPIDPQITFNSGSGMFTSPAQSILDEFNKAKEEISNNPASAAIWIKRIEKYPHGFLQICDNTIQLSKERVTDWLSKWMLSQETDAKTKAQTIAEWLGNTNEHKSHGRPLGITDLRGKGLIIKALEDDQELQEKVLSLFHSSMATHDFTDCVKIIENQNGKGSYYTFRQIPQK